MRIRRIGAKRTLLKLPKGKGGMGKSNLWYADSSKGAHFRNSVMDFIRTVAAPKPVPTKVSGKPAAQVKCATVREKGTWLYPISERGEKYFFLDDGSKIPVTLENYITLVDNGRLSEDERWYLSTNFHKVQAGDEVYVYTGDQNTGLIGYATVEKVDLKNPAVILCFDLKKCRALIENPIAAETVRKWISHPRSAVCNLAPFRSHLSKLLPWNQPDPGTAKHHNFNGSPAAAGFGTPETNKKVEKAAVKIVTKWYRDQGWSVTSVERQKRGFDLFCSKSNQTQNVEVKGVRGQEVGFIMTAGELRKAETDKDFVLKVVLEALSTQPTIRSWTGKEMIKDFKFKAIQYMAQFNPA